MNKRYLVLYNCEGNYYCHTYICNSFKHLKNLLENFVVDSYKLTFVEKIYFINSKGQLVEKTITIFH